MTSVNIAADSYSCQFCGGFRMSEPRSLGAAVAPRRGFPACAIDALGSRRSSSIRVPTSGRREAARTCATHDCASHSTLAMASLAVLGILVTPHRECAAQFLRRIGLLRVVDKHCRVVLRQAEVAVRVEPGLAVRTDDG
jgi:hypothetical protein